MSSADNTVEHDDPDPRTRTRREEAFTLYCHGYRSPAIASLLGVPQRTVRAWIASTLQAAAEESRTRRDQQLRLAIESQRAIVQAAWHAFDRAARAERLTLEHLQNAVPFNIDDADDTLALGASPYGDPPSPPQRRGGQGVRTPSPLLPRLPTAGARYLQIVLHAQREIARLSGLYDLPASFFDPNADRPMQIVIRREPHLPRQQLAAWTAFREHWDADHPDDPVPPDTLVFPPDGAPLHDYADPDDPDPDDPDPDDPHGGTLAAPNHPRDPADPGDSFRTNPPTDPAPARNLADGHLHAAAHPPSTHERAAETASPAVPAALSPLSPSASSAPSAVPLSSAPRPPRTSANSAFSVPLTRATDTPRYSGSSHPRSPRPPPAGPRAAA